MWQPTTCESVIQSVRSPLQFVFCINVPFPLLNYWRSHLQLCLKTPVMQTKSFARITTILTFTLPNGWNQLQSIYFWIETSQVIWKLFISCFVAVLALRLDLQVQGHNRAWETCNSSDTWGSRDACCWSPKPAADLQNLAVEPPNSAVDPRQGHLVEDFYNNKGRVVRVDGHDRPSHGGTGAMDMWLQWGILSGDWSLVGNYLHMFWSSEAKYLCRSLYKIPAYTVVSMLLAYQMCIVACYHFTIPFSVCSVQQT